MKKELLDGLTEEQIAKITACKSQEEMLKVAKEEGVELTDEQLEAVSGGGCTNIIECPNCGGNAKYLGSSDGPVSRSACNCPKCGIVWLN